MKVTGKFVFISLLVTIVIRILDGATDTLYFAKGPFPDPLSRIVFHEIFDAFWTFAIILCCGILVSNEISRRKAAGKSNKISFTATFGRTGEGTKGNFQRVAR